MAGPMNILMVLDSLQVGGTETYVLSVTKELQKQGARVIIVANEGPMMEAFQKLGCPIYVIDFCSHAISFEEQSRKVFYQLKEIIKREKITIIHSHQYPSAHFSSFTAKNLGIPFIFTIHGTYYDVNLLLEIKNDTTFIAVSHPIQEWLQKNSIPCIMISNGIDTNEFSSHEGKNIVRNQVGIPQNSKILLYCSRLSWEKADICIELMKACAEIVKTDFPDLKLMIIGTGQHDKNIQNSVYSIEQEVGRQFISFLGWKQDLRPFYIISDCVVGTGRVALEAMSCETPVIAAGSKGFLGLINPNEYKGLYYYFGDHRHLENWSKENLLQSITDFLHLSSENQISIGKDSRIFVNRFFHIETTVSQLLCIYTLL
ncbi:glycosyltransferase [Bacillus toyonensis]|uniref:Glycosyltransferase family 1 protein n=1 Tax=Bacillus toyonensis TaxID=155322 RepID=A0A2B5CYH3_9BACI|nr:glycosyltransferase [Bacillus toyonensis]PEJ84963.1 hypothetical protein CN688_30420 [Bacillus toyonensis]PEK78551.1 hypothetical protein CN594_26265 [Bacillus toyonensis]PEL21352.1 hypothetical protein CN624_26125 [Bacillus toyonensis]PEO56686.1 hypothetical protein CN579_20815 [Bacillus toyonensis]PFY32773.1 hypothetical protein COL54_31460 [Bacillus toyonensis]